MSKAIYEDMPRDMRQYLSNYGWHFNQRMLDWAVGMMRDKTGSKIKPITKEGLELMFKNAGIELKTEHIYDAPRLSPMNCTWYAMCPTISTTRTVTRVCRLCGSMPTPA